MFRLVPGVLVCAGLAASGAAFAIDTRTVTTSGAVTWVGGNLDTTSGSAWIQVAATDAFGAPVGSLKVARSEADLGPLREVLGAIDAFATPAIHGSLDAIAAGKDQFTLDESGERKAAVLSDLFLKAFGLQVFANGTGDLAIDDPNDALAPLVLAEGDTVEVFFRRDHGLPGFSGPDCSEDGKCGVELFGASLAVDIAAKRPALVARQTAAASYGDGATPWTWGGSEAIYYSAVPGAESTDVTSLAGLLALRRGGEKNTKKTITWEIDTWGKDVPAVGDTTTGSWTPAPTVRDAIATQPVTDALLTIQAVRREAAAGKMSVETLDALYCQAAGVFGLGAGYFVADHDANGSLDVGIVTREGTSVVAGESAPGVVSSLEAADPETVDAVGLLYTAAPLATGKLDETLVGSLVPTKALIAQRTAEGYALVEVDLATGAMTSTKHATDEELGAFLAGWYDKNVYAGYRPRLGKAGGIFNKAKGAVR